MPQVQSKLNLPTRKPRSCRLAKQEVKLTSSMDDEAIPAQTPGKRRGPKVAADQAGVSPVKCARGGAAKENITVSSPSACLQKLSLVSPGARRPLQENAESHAGVRRGNLFSPRKLDAESIETLLFSPSEGARNRRTAGDVIGDRDISFKSPMKQDPLNQNKCNQTMTQFKKPLDKDPSPVLASPAKPKVCPVKPRSSPLKGLSFSDLEDLLCSPEKPRPVLAARSPRRPPPTQNTPARTMLKKPSPIKISSVSELEDLLCSPVKEVEASRPVEAVRCAPVTRSPRKPCTPVKSPRKGAANLFSSPGRAPHPPAPQLEQTLFKVDVTQLQAARSALHTGTPGELLCRAEQVTSMSIWLDDHLLKPRPGSLYVSGAPGTGKTATLSYLLSSKLGSHRTIFINCMILKSSVAIYKEVARQLNKKSTARTEKEALKEIEKVVTSKGDMILLVLDEVDQLESKHQDVLYTVFEWPALTASRLSLVGIANTLDLTDRVLPRLQVKDCYRPTLLHYPPYNKQQIIEIITKRLAASGVEKDVIAPRAIAYLAGKISTLSGDIRKALDVCRRALEQAETSARKQTLLKTMTPRGLASPAKSPHKGYKDSRPLPRVGQVDLPQIMRVINQVYGSKLNSCLSTGCGGIPTQQKVLLASLLLLVKRGTSKEVTLGKLVQAYTKVCKKRGMVVGEEGECVGMVQSLESRGMLSYANKGAAPRYAKISLRLDEKEVEMALEDKTLLSSIVEDTSCLP